MSELLFFIHTLMVLVLSSRTFAWITQKPSWYAKNQILYICSLSNYMYRASSLTLIQ